MGLEWVRDFVYHDSGLGKEKDFSGEYVLICENFNYFGKEAVEIPKWFQKLIFKLGNKKNSMMD